MGMAELEAQSKALSGGSSSMPESDSVVQGSEKVKEGLREAFGGLKNGEELCVVPENGDGFSISSIGNEGLGDHGLVEVVKSSVLEAKVSVLSENECHVLADSEMNGVPSVLETPESGVSMVVSSDVTEKLDCGITSKSESGVAEADVLGVDGLVGVGGEGKTDGEKNEEEEERNEDCDGNIVIVEVPIVEASENIDVVVEELNDEESEEEGKNEDCDGNVVTVEVPIVEVSENTAVVAEESNDEENEEQEKTEDCDRNIVTVEVPIVETSENIDVVMEELNDEECGFSVGDFVWGKVESDIWWPGQVYDPSYASDIALGLKQKNKLLVAYFGNGTSVWCDPLELKPFEENYEDMVKQASSVAFVNAVQEAVNDFGRLLNVKMSHLFVDKKIVSGFASPSVKTCGIREGVLVPENGLERLLDVPIEPVELLSQLKQIAEIMDIASVMELEMLKAQLSAFYLSRGGYRLPDYVDPQPLFGFEDTLMDETVDAGNSKNAVEAPARGPFEEDYSTLPLSSKIDDLNHGRKQKSMAEIMGDDKDVHTKIREGDDVTEGTVHALGSNGTKRKGRESAPASKSVQKKKELGVESDGSEDKDSSDAEIQMLLKENKVASGDENISSGNKGQNEKGYLSRERKKSKYLCPPFTTSIRDLDEESIQIEALRFSTKAKVSSEWKLFDSSNHQSKENNGNKIFYPRKLQAPSVGVLSQVLYAAVSPQTPLQSTSVDEFVNYISAFRNSLCHQGLSDEAYKKPQPGRKRKKLESDHITSPQNQDSEPTKRRKETTPRMPKVKKAPETNTGKKGTAENAAGAVLYVSFFPGSSLPSRSDLIDVYGKFGALNETETDMFRMNYTARVSFQRASDAEEALNHSQNNNPFGSSDVTFHLQYTSDGSKSAQHGERSKKGRTMATPSASVSQPHGGEASNLNFIKQKLHGLTSMLESSDGKSPDMITKLEGEMKALLEDVNKMVESCSC
ncbi:hypothetical protein RJT34_27754 [Clitoria ternatea]|uniref:PWWP domain-containing protein n=1 Tax=Clitoria ternatea TaxID=43366 RepID=A0AAN9FGV7_CLITE